jgi:hypothetical protein
MQMLCTLQHLIAMSIIQVRNNFVLLSYFRFTYVRVDVFMPQGQYQSGSTVADSAVVHLLSGNDVTRRPPRSPSTVNQQAVLQSSYTPYIHDPSPMDPWLAADFSHFGEAPTSLFQVANFSQFGGTYTEVAQPADFSDFGNTSTVMPPTSVWPVNEHNIHFLHGEH